MTADAKRVSQVGSIPVARNVLARASACDRFPRQPAVSRSLASYRTSAAS